MIKSKKIKLLMEKNTELEKMVSNLIADNDFLARQIEGLSNYEEAYDIYKKKIAEVNDLKLEYKRLISEVNCERKIFGEKFRRLMFELSMR